MAPAPFTIAAVPNPPGAPGCRNTAIATVLLVGSALVFMAIGLALANQTDCSGGCETLALTLLYGGLPISAIFNVVFGDLVVAWPLDVTFWVIIGFLLARHCERRRRGVLGAVLVTVLLALGYGLVLSTLVDLAIQ